MLRFSSLNSSWLAGKPGAWRNSRWRPGRRSVSQRGKRRPTKGRDWGRSQQSFSTPSRVLAPSGPAWARPLDTQTAAASHGVPHTNGRLGGNCGKCSSVWAGSAAFADHNPQQAPRVRRRFTQSLRGGRGCGGAGRPQRLPRRFELGAAGVRWFPSWCVWGSTLGVRERVRGFRTQRRARRAPSSVGLSHNYDLGGERLPLEGGNRPTWRSFVPFPVGTLGCVSSGPRPRCARCSAGLYFSWRKIGKEAVMFSSTSSRWTKGQFCQIERSWYRTILYKAMTSFQNEEYFSTTAHLFTYREYNEHLFFGVMGVRVYTYKSIVTRARRRQGLLVAWCAFPRMYRQWS